MVNLFRQLDVIHAEVQKLVMLSLSWKSLKMYRKETNKMVSSARKRRKINKSTHEA